jgi:serine/threonine protein kinase
MQYVPGKTSRIGRRKSLDLDTVFSSVTVGDALVAHAKGIVHRDIKSSNIITAR